MISLTNVLSRPYYLLSCPSLSGKLLMALGHGAVLNDRSLLQCMMHGANGFLCKRYYILHRWLETEAEEWLLAFEALSTLINFLDLPLPSLFSSRGNLDALHGRSALILQPEPLSSMRRGCFLRRDDLGSHRPSKILLNVIPAPFHGLSRMRPS